jgi:hypothetical protein
LQLFDAVKLDESKWNTKGRNIILNIIKADPTAEYWPRLTKDKIKNAHIQADWAKWVDEDEEEEAKPVGEEWNEDNMNNFNMGGMQGGDSDDEEEEEEEEHGHPHGHDHHGHDHSHGHSHDHGHEHVHSENCSHGKPAGKIDDLDEEADAQ